MEEQTYFLRMSGRCANGAERDSGRLIHAVRSKGFPGWKPAVCGATPGPKGNGWSETFTQAAEATCTRCIKKLSVTNLTAEAQS
jgi:hypothetical protein